MAALPLAEEARLESAVVILDVLSDWGERIRWRLFGSWAIFLHSAGWTRLPRDLDVDVLAHDNAWAQDLPAWRAARHPYCCTASERRTIIFSSPSDAPTAYWQDVRVTSGPTWLSTETINWVWRGPSRRPAEVVVVASQEAVRLGDRHPSVSVPCAALEECLAQKWTRLAKARSGGRRHTRWIDLADLYDLLVLRKAVVADDLFRSWILELGKERRISSPFLLPTPPLEWLDTWDYYNYRTQTARPSPTEVTEILNEMYVTSRGGD
jgi:hypothetical protein